MPKGALDDVGHRQIEVRARGNDEGILSTGLCEKRKISTPRAEQLRGLKTTGQNQSVYTRVRNQAAPDLAFLNIHQLEHVLRDSGRPQGLHHHCTTASNLGCWLNGDSTTGGKRRQNRPRRNSNREVPWWCNEGETRRLELGPVNGVQFDCQFGVVASKINGLADLGVSLLESLAGLLHHHGQQLCSFETQLVSGLQQNCSALLARLLSPFGSCLAPTRHEVVHRDTALDGSEGIRNPRLPQ